MTSIMNGTTETAKHVMASAMEGAEHVADTAKHAVDTAKHAAGSAKAEAEHTFSNGLAMVLAGVKTVGGIMTMLRSLGVNDALGWVGLRRRRDPLMGFALFGAGLAVGAGVGVLFAPASGRDLRRAMRRGFKGLSGDAKDALHRVETEVKHVEEKVEEKAEEMAGKAKDVVMKAEHKVEAAAGAVMDAASGTKPTAGGAHPTPPANGHR